MKRSDAFVRVNREWLADMEDAAVRAIGALDAVIPWASTSIVDELIEARQALKEALDAR